jgi:hypothetical protein
LTKTPEGFRFASVQAVELVPGLNAADVSPSAETDQLVQPTPLASRKFHQTCVSAGSKVPFPLASLVPYSVAKIATPLFKAAATLLISH